MFKKTAVALILFLASLCGGMAQTHHVPTLESDNNWTGTNNFQLGKLSYGTVDSTCPAGPQQYMVGYHASDFSPICVSISTTAGVNSIGTTATALQGNVVIVNTDSNLSVNTSGQDIVINCPGCGSGGGGNPGGTQGAIQTAGASSNFVGTVITGVVVGQGTGIPRAGVGNGNSLGGDFALPLVISCGTGLSCPYTSGTYNFTLTGSAGTGAVATGINGQNGGYLATGTTISPAPNSWTLNPGWTLGQMTGLFSRFDGAQITSYSITSNVATFQAVNGYVAGDTPHLFNFPSSTFFNNQPITVLSSGLSNTQFEAAFTHADTSATENGVSSFNAFNQIPGSQGFVVIPPGMVADDPSNAFVNLNLSGGGVSATSLDMRKGYALQMASNYGIKCDYITFGVSFSSGATTVGGGANFNVSVNPVGMTMIAVSKSGFGNSSTQIVWTPTITDDGELWHYFWES